MKNKQDENCATWLTALYERWAALWERVAFSVPAAESAQYFAKADKYHALAKRQRERAAKTQGGAL